MPPPRVNPTTWCGRSALQEQGHSCRVERPLSRGEIHCGRLHIIQKRHAYSRGDTWCKDRLRMTLSQNNHFLRHCNEF